MSKGHCFKTYAVILAGALSMMAAPVIADAETDEGDIFTDVTKETVPDAEVRDMIQHLKDKDVIKGYDDGSFKPHQAVTRGQVAQMLTKDFDISVPKDVAGINAMYTDRDHFSNIADDVAAVTDADLFSGDTEGNFNAWNPLKREQMASVMMHYMQSKNVDDAEKVDVNLNHVSKVHKKAVQYLANHHITNVPKDFNAHEKVTRMQLASFLQRAIDTIESNKSHDNAVDDNHDATEKMGQLNIEEIEIEAEYEDGKAYEVEIEHKSDGVYTSEIEDDLHEEYVKGKAAFDKLYPLVKKLDITPESTKEDVFGQVLDVFGLEDNYKELEVEIDFHDHDEELEFEYK